MDPAITTTGDIFIEQQCHINKQLVANPDSVQGSYTQQERYLIKESEQSNELAACVHRQWSQQLEHAVFVVDKDNRVLFSEGSTEKFIQQNFCEFSAEQPDLTTIARRGLKSRLRPLLQRVWRNGLSINTPARAYKDGTYHHCHVHIGKLEGYQNNQQALMVLLHPNYPDADKSRCSNELAGLQQSSSTKAMECKHSEASLQQLHLEPMTVDESKRLFLASMSHEIRTPMTAILGYTDLLIEKEENDETRQYLQTINRNAEKLMNTINELLDVSKMEAGNLETGKDFFSPAKLMLEISESLSLRARMKQISLDCTSTSDTPTLVNTDKRILKQILINLTGNAIRFTENGGVTMSVRYEPLEENLSDSPLDEGQVQAGNLAITIRDTGIGISHEQQHQLFVPGPQSLSGPSRHDEGLGLVMSQKLAAMLGGSITFESSPGHGSTFTLSVPAPASQWPSHDKGHEISYSDNPTAPNPQIRRFHFQAHILVADDRSDIRCLSEHFLNEAGARVSIAEDGTQVMDLYRLSLKENDPIDLILLDMKMPNKDGYETAAELRSLNYRGPIIALTADNLHSAALRCANSGCDNLLPKPINKQRMLQTIDRYLKSTYLHDQ